MRGVVAEVECREGERKYSVPLTSGTGEVLTNVARCGCLDVREGLAIVVCHIKAHICSGWQGAWRYGTGRMTVSKYHKQRQ